jgi:membrane protease YdiL (CAAX protease family)
MCAEFAAQEIITNRPAKTWRTIAGLAGALFFGLAPIAKWLVPGSELGAMLGREAVWWVLAAAILAWLRWGEGLPLSSIGIRAINWKSVVFGVLAAITVTIAIGVQFAVIIPRFHLNAAPALAAQKMILSTPYSFRVMMVLRAAVVEEILFRGYLIEKLRQVAGSNWIAVLGSVAAFTYAHLAGWGAVQLIPVAASGLIFALLYVWRRDLKSNMIGHFIADGLGFLTR